MEWVFDTSVTMAWCFDDERTPQTEAMLDRLVAGSPAVVATIWPLEVANVLSLAASKRRITQARRRQFLAMLESMPITVDAHSMKSVFADVLQVAEQFHLTAYDASYLELSMRLALPLATLDKPLRNAAARAGVVVLA
jgi:predicted nucleic acid-binding protein